VRFKSGINGGKNVSFCFLKIRRTFLIYWQVPKDRLYLVRSHLIKERVTATLTSGLNLIRILIAFFPSKLYIKLEFKLISNDLVCYDINFFLP
jgi:hypothetical protein